MPWQRLRRRQQPRDLPGLRRSRLCYPAAAHALWRDADPAALLPLRRQGQAGQEPLQGLPRRGKTAAKKTLEVSIPMGIDDDQSFALRGMGDAGTNGGPAGDVIVMVTVRPSEVFQRDGYDVWVTVPITYSQAVLGDSITVPSIDGKVEYTVPEGTQSGTTFRLRGKGIQYLNGRGRGDMYVKCEVEIPKKLNKAQRDALKKFEGTLKEENYEKRKGFFKKLKDMFA